MLYGMDISEHQKNIDLSKDNYDFCIIKATEGIGYTDKSFKNFAFQLTELNKLIGCYHFARPDLRTGPSGIEQEADWFIHNVREAGLLNKAILVLDWEVEPMEREDLIEAFCNRVKARCGIRPFIYTNKYMLTKIGGYSIVQTSPLWLAVWPSITKYHIGEPPSDLTLPSSSPQWKVWQYSSTGVYSGFPQNIDLDMCSMSVGEWKTMSGEEKISADMRWAIENGLFEGDGHGSYYPEQPLTRSQCATVLRRYTERFL